MKTNNRPVWAISVWVFAAILIVPTISSFATAHGDDGSDDTSQCEDYCDEEYDERSRECTTLYDECVQFCSLSSHTFGEYEICTESCSIQYDYCSTHAAAMWAACRDGCK